MDHLKSKTQLHALYFVVEQAACLIQNKYRSWRIHCRDIENKCFVAIILQSLFRRRIAKLITQKRRIGYNMKNRAILQFVRNRIGASKKIQRVWRYYVKQKIYALTRTNYCFKLFRSNLLSALNDVQGNCSHTKNVHHLLLECPITREIPSYNNIAYCTVDGHFYDYKPLSSWVSKHRASPLTRETVHMSDIIVWNEYRERLKYRKKASFQIDACSQFVFNDSSGNVHCIATKEDLLSTSGVTFDVSFLAPISISKQYAGQLDVRMNGNGISVYWRNNVSDNLFLQYPIMGLTISIAKKVMVMSHSPIQGLSAMIKNKDGMEEIIDYCELNILSNKRHLKLGNDTIEIDAAGQPVDTDLSIKYATRKNTSESEIGYGWNKFIDYEDAIGPDGKCEIILSLS